MSPIRVTAALVGGVSMPGGPLALDALLMSVIARRQQLPPPGIAPLVEIDIPIAKESLGRFHLASFALFPRPEMHERRYVQRRFPAAEAQVLAVPSFRRIDISAGAQKSYRIPGEITHPSEEQLEWYAIGDEHAVRDLLADVTHLGKRRAVGRGKVARWTVEPCASWGEGFPVSRDGVALRTLPADWPDLVNPVLGWRVLSPPYWEHAREERCALAENPP